MLDGPLEVLSGMVRNQTKNNLPVPQVGGCAQGQQPCHFKDWFSLATESESKSES